MAEIAFPPPSKARRETEIKLRVSDPARLRRRLIELGFVLRTPRHHERNVLFDFPDYRLTRSDRMLRLRVARGGATLTWKERPREVAGHKTRDEIETSVGSARELRSVLERLGMIAVARYSKRRTEYSITDATRPRRAPVVAFDETGAGYFVELEGSRSWIDRTAKQLGYSRRDYITSSYLQLLSGLSKAAVNSRMSQPARTRSRLIS